MRSSINRAHYESDFDTAESLIYDAASIIKKHAIIGSAEFESLIRYILIVPPGWLRSVTFTTHLGLIIIGARAEWTMLDYFDLLVHETSHHSLEFQCMTRKYLTDEEKLVFSPLRSKLRPAIAVLHSVFVTSRLTTALRQWIQFGLPNKTQAEERVKDYIARTTTGLNALREAGVLTKDGRVLCSTLTRL
ncbi:MAG: HEXXH motif-containing putative peptide modification protein [Candidatus Thiodiazotropha endolucinida]